MKNLKGRVFRSIHNGFAVIYLDHDIFRVSYLWVDRHSSGTGYGKTDSHINILETGYLVEMICLVK